MAEDHDNQHDNQFDIIVRASSTKAAAALRRVILPDPGLVSWAAQELSAYDPADGLAVAFPNA